MLHHGGKEAQNGTVDQAVELVLDLVFGDEVALFARFQVVVVQRRAHLAAEKEQVALKVHIKAAEIHVCRADDAHAVVADNALGVQESRRVAVNFDSFLDQFGIKGLGHGKHVFFVGNVGHGDAHVHAALRRVDERALHLSVQDEVGRVDVHIFLRVVDDLQVQIFADVPFLGARRVAERRAENVPRGAVRKVLCVIFLFAAQRPELEKHGGKVLHHSAAHEDARIFPRPEGMRLVDVFVREVHAAREGDLAVDDGNFSVRAVVLRDVEDGSEGVETHTFDPFLFHLLGKVSGDFQHGADVVVDQTHVHARVCFFNKNVRDRIKKFARLNDKVFQKNIFFRFFQLVKQRFAVILPHREVFKVRAVGKGHPRKGGDVFRATVGKAVRLREGNGLFSRFCVQAFGAAEGVRQHPAPAPRHLVPAQQQVQHRPRGRNGKHGHQPGDLVFGVHVRVDDIDRDDDVHKKEHDVENGGSVRHPCAENEDGHGDKRQLQQQ